MKPEFKVEKISSYNSKVRVKVSITFTSDTFLGMYRAHGVVEGSPTTFIEGLFKRNYFLKCNLNGFLSDENLVLSTFCFVMQKAYFKKLKKRMEKVSKELGSGQKMESVFAKRIDYEIKCVMHGF